MAGLATPKDRKTAAIEWLANYLKNEYANTKKAFLEHPYTTAGTAGALGFASDSLGSSPIDTALTVSSVVAPRLTGAVTAPFSVYDAAKNVYNGDYLEAGNSLASLAMLKGYVPSLAVAAPFVVTKELRDQVNSGVKDSGVNEEEYNVLEEKVRGIEQEVAEWKAMGRSDEDIENDIATELEQLYAVNPRLADNVSLYFQTPKEQRRVQLYNPDNLVHKLAKWAFDVDINPDPVGHIANYTPVDPSTAFQQNLQTMRETAEQQSQQPTTPATNEDTNTGGIIPTANAAEIPPNAIPAVSTPVQQPQALSQLVNGGNIWTTGDASKAKSGVTWSMADPNSEQYKRLKASADFANSLNSYKNRTDLSDAQKEQMAIADLIALGLK